MSITDPAVVFIAAFGLALTIEVSFVLFGARRSGAGWNERTRLELADFALCTLFVTASCVIGVALFSNTLTLLARCAIGLAVLLPVCWMTSVAFARIEARKKALADERG